MKGQSPVKPVSIGYMPLVYMALVVLALTLEPFQFRFPSHYHMVLRGSYRDIAENVLLFAPLGFLLRTGSKRTRPTLGMDALIMGLVFSMGIEGLQLFLPKRYTTFSDVVANGAGAWLGALTYEWITRKLDEQEVVKVLSLDLPLSTLAYLLVPLIWLNALCARFHETRYVLIAFPMVMSSVVLSSVYVHRIRTRPGIVPWGAVWVSLMFLVLSLMPLLLMHPHLVLEMAVLSTGVTVFIVFTKATPSDDKRFEIPTLKKVLPIFLIYMLILSAWPLTFDVRRFAFQWGFTPLTGRWDKVFYLRFEMTAAFSVLGYIIAELRSRKSEHRLVCMGYIILVSLAFALAIELVWGVRPDRVFSVVEFLLFVMAACFGGVIYLDIAKAFYRR
jgi:VanZ family protein